MSGSPLPRPGSILPVRRGAPSSSDALGELLAKAPRGLSSASLRRWRVEAMLDAGYGWEDVRVASLDWPCGAVPPLAAREIALGREATA